MILTFCVKDMWFRMLVKTIPKIGASSYKWDEMTFCFRWEPGSCAVLCIGIDGLFSSLLKESLHHMWSDLPPSQPCSMLVPLFETIISMYDQAVWSIRDAVRGVEMVSAIENR